MSELNTARLKQARERRGLNQIELSKLLGTAAGLAGQWERGLREPSLSKLKQLAKALEVPIGWLVGEGEDEPDRVTEAASVYGAAPIEQHGSREAVLSDYNAPVGLRDLASDAALVKALRIESPEWAALASLDFADGLTKEGYTAALMLLRTASIEARRCELAGRPGRHVKAT